MICTLDALADIRKTSARPARFSASRRDAAAAAPLGQDSRKRPPPSRLVRWQADPNRRAHRDRKRCGNPLTRSPDENVSFVVLVLLVSRARHWLARRVGPERPHARRAEPVRRDGPRSGAP